MNIHAALNAYFLAIDGILSPATVRWYRSHLASFETYHANRDIDDLTIDDLRAWRKTLTSKTTRYKNDKFHHEQPGKLSPDYIAGSVRAVRRLYSWLEAEGRIDRNPSRRLEKPPSPIAYRKGITPADRDKLFAAVRANPRDYALLRFLASTACRRAGAAGLLVSDLDLDTCTAVIHEKGRGGNRKDRPVFFGRSTAQAIKHWLTVRPKQTASVFDLKPNGIYQVLRRAAKRAGVTGRWAPHQWRHAAIRGWLNNGMPLSKASQLAGHSSVKITGDIYGTSNQNELQTALNTYQWSD
jgi:site-specific recombinase XerD